MAQFPEIELDASTPVTTYHKVIFTISSRQDGGDWASQVNTYHHMANSHLAFLTGNVAGLGMKLGQKGNSPRNQNFDLTVSLTVDGQETLVPKPEWNGKSREFILLAELGLAKMWLRMVEDSIEINKAHEKAFT